MYTKIDEVFCAALEVPADQREYFLNATCNGDQELRSAVLRLLRSSQGPCSLLTTGGAGQGQLWQEVCAGMTAAPLPLAGERVGRYRLLEELSRGGMGVVYLGERADGQFQQRVAVKLLKLGIDSEELTRRFQQERQILASLDHPGVVRLLDGGVTGSGRQYFAMEYVEGQPIDRYCDTHRLTIDERLAYLVAVAEVVQHAHQRLVVHRDLKPSNILVNRRGEVRLLDFGIAKLLGDDTDRGAAPTTSSNLRVMTPEYASPEQVRGGTISLASDVYQLGLLLYELLTGRRPYRLRGRSLAEQEQVICTTEPKPPSAVVIESHAAGPRRAGDGPVQTARQTARQTEMQTATQMAMARRSSPQRLRRKLRGDLDAIVLTALRKEPERRYQTVEQLLQDLRRYREGRPVLARKETWRYRLWRLAHHRLVMLNLVVSLLVLAVGLVSDHTVRLVQERDQARMAAAQAAELASVLRAQLEVSDHAQGKEASARELIDPGATGLGSGLVACSGEERVAFARVQAPGLLYQEQGCCNGAAPLLSRALVLTSGSGGCDSLDAAAEHLLLTDLLAVLAQQRSDQSDDAEVLRLLRLMATAGWYSRDLNERCRQHGIPSAQTTSS